ncbi:MAG: methylmalonyl Co-A mutase-associated GTPase MeaB [Thermodesulfobacteriota bacterium]|nr:methylmalonyl Co-A mutase-associated GTPase MeaB [Thermodesulfobacteriota bacterium]
MIAENADYYIDGVLEGNRRVIAKTITLVESSLPAHQEKAKTIIDNLLPYSGEAVRIGITGIPGVGKSAFIESFGMMLLKDDHRIAVLAVDPSSKKSGGSVMGDKTRMERLSVEECAFIRPSPSGGTLGGVARKTRETMIVCEAAGFDVIIVETVGVGQSETTVASMVDFFLVLMLSGAGDELQGIKKGVLELADAITITKTDGDNIEKAKRARKEYETALHLINPSSANWLPPVTTCSAIKFEGMENIWNIILNHRDKLKSNGEFEEKRKNQSIEWMWSLVEEGLKDQFYKNTDVKTMLPKVKKEVEKGKMAPTAAAFKLLSFFSHKGVSSSTGSNRRHNDF